MPLDHRRWGLLKKYHEVLISIRVPLWSQFDILFLASIRGCVQFQ